jgi:hypothetical protein
MYNGLHILTWNRTKNSLAFALSGVRGTGGGEKLMGMIQQMYNIDPAGIVTMTLPCIMNIY